MDMTDLAVYTNAVREPAANDKAAQSRLVVAHASLVKRIAYHLMARLPPSVQVDDLIQAGMIGLLEASKSYDASQGASFETYAGIRIRGAMLDEIRRGDWAPRSLHRKVRQIAEAVRTIEAKEGRDARGAEIAEHLNISLDEYHELLLASVNHRIFSIDELPSPSDITKGTSDGIPAPHEVAENEDFRNALERAIASLPERERLVMSLYYKDELNLRETGQVLGVSESRVCQIHAQALVRLKARLAEWTKPD
jgi:RNA polymerase sigma factor FliA